MEQAFERVEKHLYLRHTSSPVSIRSRGTRSAARHSAKTNWSRCNIHVDIVMPAAGHSSVQMHKRYVNLKGSDVAEAFGLSHTDLKKDVASYQFA